MQLTTAILEQNRLVELETDRRKRVVSETWFKPQDGETGDQPNDAWDPFVVWQALIKR